VFENSLGKNKDMSRIKRKIPPNKSSPETVVQDVDGDILIKVKKREHYDHMLETHLKKEEVLRSATNTSIPVQREAEYPNVRATCPQRLQFKNE